MVDIQKQADLADPYHHFLTVLQPLPHLLGRYALALQLLSQQPLHLLVKVREDLFLAVLLD